MVLMNIHIISYYLSGMVIKFIHTPRYVIPGSTIVLTSLATRSFRTEFVCKVNFNRKYKSMQRFITTSMSFHQLLLSVCNDSSTGKKCHFLLLLALWVKLFVFVTSILYNSYLLQWLSPFLLNESHFSFGLL